MNLFKNPFFTGDDGSGPSHNWQDDHGTYDNMAIPAGWRFFCQYDEPFEGILSGLVARRPECKLSWHTTLEQWITGTTSFVWKVFLNQPLWYAFEPVEPIVVEPGQWYHVYVNGAFECVASYENGKTFVDDLWAAWGWLNIPGVWDSEVINGFTHEAVYRTLDFGRFMVPEGVTQITPRFKFRWKYQSAGNNAFFDEVWLEPVEGTPEDEPATPVAIDLQPVMKQLDQVVELLQSINEALWQ